MSELLDRLESRKDEVVELVRTLVEFESPSTNKVLVDRLGRFIAEHIRQSGLQPHVIPRKEVGDLLWAEWGSGEGRTLILCHIDTVWGEGSLACNPCRIEDGRLYGPGVFDMKAGVAASLMVQQLLKQGAITPRGRVRFLYTSDEETASCHSRETIEEFAAGSRAVLVPEPPMPDGGLKTFRKGVAEYRIRIGGRSAHAGVEPHRGVNALSELARQIPAIHALGDDRRGSTVNVTVAYGGTRSNVIPDDAQALIDCRFNTLEEGRRIQAGLESLRPVLPQARIDVRCESWRPPMVRSEKTAQAFEVARKAAGELGFELREGSTGGGSDGSFTAALGIPTLDGLGVNGDGAHAVHEHIELDWVVPRIALIALLAERL